MRAFVCVGVVVERGWILVIGACGGKARVLRNSDKLWAGETSLPGDRAAVRSNSGMWSHTPFFNLNTHVTR